MNYKTHNDTNIDVNGTHLQGYINTDYDTLVELFGEPTIGDEYKTDVEWEIKFEDDTVATIYNWKNGKNYIGSDGLNVSDINEFNVGGFSKNSLWNVKEILNGRR